MRCGKPAAQRSYCHSFQPALHPYTNIFYTLHPPNTHTHTNHLKKSLIRQLLPVTLLSLLPNNVSCGYRSKTLRGSFFQFFFLDVHTHTLTHTTQMHVGFHVLRGHSIDIIIFKLYKQYIILTNPTPKLNPNHHRNLFVLLHFQINTNVYNVPTRSKMPGIIVFVETFGPNTVGFFSTTLTLT